MRFFALPALLMLSLACSEGSKLLDRPKPQGDAGAIDLDRVRATPEVLSFGLTAIGEPSSLGLRIENASDASIELTLRTGSTGLRSCAEQGTEPFCVDFAPRSLAAGASIEMTVTFAPIVAGEAETSLRFGCDRNDCGFTVALDGESIDSALECTPELLSFGAVNPGECGAQLLTCRNRANGTLELTSFALDDPRFEIAPGAPITLGPDGAQELEVRFCPLEFGLVQRALVVRSTHSSLGDESAVISIDANGGGPDLSVSPAAIDFGRVAIIAPAQRRLTVRNVGDGFLQIVAARFEGPDAAAFTVDSPGAVIDSGSSRYLELEFEPRRTGPFSATLILESNDPDQPMTEVELTGEGVLVDSCAFEIDPESIDFRDVQRGEASIAYLTIENRGSGDCLITRAELALEGEAFTFPSAIPTTIASGDRALIPVRFAPPGLGSHTNEVWIGLSSSLQPQVQVPLSGSGVGTSLLVGPQHVDFGVRTSACATAIRTVSLHNRSETPLELTSIRTLGAGFSLAAPPPLPRSLDPLEQTSLEVRFEPSEPGSYAGSVSIETGEGGASIALSGASDIAARQVDRFTQLSSTEVDVLFVLDHTFCSTQERQTLGAEIAAFLQLPRAENIDYHLGVITSDVEREQGRLIHALFPDPFGAPFADRIITEATQPSPEAVFASNARAREELGGADLEESPLEAARLALSNPLIFEDNEGFVRPQATLAVVVMADEMDQSPGTVDFYLDAFRRMKADPDQVTISTIGGDAPDGCTSPWISAPYDARTASLAERSGGILMSICSSDWATDLSRLSLPAFGVLSKFELTSVPEAGSISVSVDGVELAPAHWYLEERRLVFGVASVPEPGAEIRVEYTARCP